MREISADTQTVLLLCGGITRGESDANTLSPSEYNLLAKWLKDRSLRPADLLQQETLSRYSEEPLPKIDPHRMEELLGYAGALAIHIESWLNSGTWIISRSDDDYPARLKKVLGMDSPPLLFGVGPVSLLSNGGVAIVGSRDVDDSGADFAAELAEACARNKINVISGGARGVDQFAMAASLNNGGYAIGVLANDLSKISVISGNREAVMNDRLVLISPYHPKTHFTVGNAMGRNRIIYALSDASVVVSSSIEKGGTWYGAVENLKKWNIPLYVREAEGYLGNNELIKKGGIPFPLEALKDPAILLKSPQPELVSPLQSTDDYESILPNLLKYTIEPRSRKDIAKFLNVTQKQADVWIKHAVEEGKLEKTRKPVLYVTRKPDDSGESENIAPGQQCSLFS